MPYSPLSAGVLANKYAVPAEAAPDGTRLQLFDSYFERYANTCAPECVQCYADAAAKFGLSPAALAIAFCDSRPFVSSTIIGTTNHQAPTRARTRTRALTRTCTLTPTLAPTLARALA